MFECSRGDPGLPHHVVLYGPGPEVLGSVDLGSVTDGENQSALDRIPGVGDRAPADLRTREGRLPAFDFPSADGHGISSSFPVVVRDSMSVWARAASASG